MKIKQEPTVLFERLNKSLAELMEVLGEIDLDDPSNSTNEWTIDDNNGGRILLGYAGAKREITVTKDRLKLIMYVQDMSKNDYKTAT